MITRYRVSLGGVQLDSLDDGIVILDVGYTPVNKTENTFSVANLDGFDTADEYCEKQSVTVTFELHIYDTKKRNKVCQKINEWASNRGTLTVNDREGQYLQDVKCDQYAAIESVRNWTDPLTLVFSTEYTPYWLSNAENTLTLTGKSTRGTLKMDGNKGDALVTAEVTANEPITALQIKVGSTMLKLTGLSVAKNQKVIVDYVRSRYLRIRANGSSVMDKLTADSSDNLLAPCGANTSVEITASNKVTAVIAGRGQWL